MTSITQLLCDPYSTYEVNNIMGLLPIYRRLKMLNRGPNKPSIEVLGRKEFQHHLIQIRPTLRIINLLEN